MFNFLLLIAIIISSIIIGGTVLIFRTQLDKDKQPENRPLVINRQPQISKGHALGVAKNIIIGDKRVEIEFLPRDYNLPKETKEDKNFKVEPIKLFFDKKQVDTYASWSSHTIIIETFPQEINNLPEEILQKFPEIAYRITRNNELKDTSDLYKQRMENLKKASKLTTGGEIFRKEALTNREFLKDRTELKVNLEKNEDKK